METVINQERIHQYFSIIKENIKDNNINGYYSINRKMEDIVLKLLELTYGYKLKNMNDIYPNYPAIDLADDKRRISIQVTADNSLEKINRTFEVFKNSKENLIERYDKVIFFMTKGKLPKYDKRKIKNQGIDFKIIDYDDISKDIASFTNEELYPIATFLESQYVSKLVKKLSEIKRKECKDITTNYVERKVLQVGINDYFNTENRENLYEVLKNNSKVVLLSNAGEGKTEEAKRIVNLINEKEKNVCAFYKRLNTYVDKEIEDMIPNEYKGLPVQNILFVFDGLDEIENKNRNTFIKKLEEFCEDNQDIRVFVTCRKNFYENHNTNFDGTLKGFKEYILCRINEEDINQLLLRHNIEQDEFWKEINKKKLYYMVYNPFYLNEIIKRYLRDKVLPSREELLDSMIDERFLRDKNKYKDSIKLDYFKEQLDNLLEIIGITLEYLGKNFLTSKEYHELILIPENREILNYSSLWTRNDDGNWSFVHNNFGEYLAARRLNKYPIEIVKKAVTFKNIPQKINPTWINTLTFLVNKYKNPELIEWIITVMPEFLFYIEKDILDTSKQKKIFWEIYRQCKEKRVWMTDNIYQTNNLVSDESDIKYLLQEIKENYHYTSVGNSLDILANTDSLYGQEHEIKETLMNICLNNNYTRYNKSTAIEVLAIYNLANLEDLRNIVEFNRKIENSRLRKSYYYFCNKLKIVNEGIDIFLERFDIEKKGMRATWSEEDDEIYFWDEHFEYEKAFGLIDNDKTLNKIIDFFNKEKFIVGEDTRNIIKNICDSVFNTYSIPKDIINILLKIYTKCEENYNYENMNIVISKVKKENILLDFFKEYIKLEKNKAYRAYEQIIDDECMEYYFGEYEKGKFSDEVTEKILFFCNSKLKYYNKLKELYQKKTNRVIQERQTVDYNKIRNESIEYFLSKLFSKDDFLKLVEELKNEMHFKQFSVKELKETRHYEKIEYNIKYQYLFNFLIFHLKDEEEITDKTFENWNWDFVILSEVYRIISTEKNSIELNNEQKAIIKDICYRKIQEVDFRNAIKYKKDKSWTTNWICIYLWFYRYKLNLKYPDNILLDMLEFDFSINGENVGINYILEQTNTIEVKNRIIENLNKREIHMDVFKNHIEYCLKNNIGNCIEAVGKHLLNNRLYDSERILALDYILEFMTIEDFIDKYFYNLELNFQKQILERIIKKDSIILKPWIVEKLKRSKKLENKMFFAQQLIKMEQIEGIKYYYYWLKKSNQPYIDKSRFNGINSELGNIKNIEMLDYLIGILELTFSKDFKDKSFEGIYSNVRKSIIVIGAENEKQYEIVENKLNELFDRNKDYDDIGLVSYIIKEIEDLYCKQNQSVMSIENIKQSIKQFDEQMQNNEIRNWI